MENQFQLFYKKACRDRRIKGLIIGMSAAMLTVGALLLAAKLLRLPLLYCLPGIAVGPIAAGLFLLFHRIRARSLAKRMDRDFSLQEKVQTMVAFSEREGEMIRIQREDTLQKLSGIPLKRLRFTRVGVYLLLPILSAALLVTAVACPTKRVEEDPPYEEPPREVTQWEWQALDELIVYVVESEADPYVMKPKTVNLLTNLKSLLKSGVSQSALERFVNSVLSQIRNIEVEAAEQKDITELQKEQNSELCSYVIEKLCEIFGLEIPQEDGEDIGGPGEPDTDMSGDGEQNDQTGTGDVVMGADEKFFDDVLGYVSYGQVISDYYNEIIRAMDEGVLPAEQWSDYLETYFEYLYGSRD